MENSVNVPQKIKNRTTVWPSNHTSGFIPKKEKKKRKLESQRDILHSHVHCSIIHNNEDMETIQISIHRWMDKGYV